MTSSEDQSFTAFLRQKALEAQELGYQPNQFLGMLGSEGGYRTVLKLLSKRTPSEGFTRLWELKRLDLTVEALVVESRWRSRFDDQLLMKAEKLLSDVGYRYKRYESGSMENLGESLEELSEVAVVAVPPKRRNTQSFSSFCELLGAPLKNVADRWCGISEERRLAVFTVWADRLKDSKYIFWDETVHEKDSRVGAKELREVIGILMENGGYRAYGIHCEAVDPSATTRKRGYYLEDTVLVLRFSKEAPGIVAYVDGEVPASTVIAGGTPPLKPFSSAEDDIDVPPPGSSTPGRRSHVVSGYRRDDAVRQYVLRRSGGRCEYCGSEGFELPDGSHYVEAHHVLALSAKGPDTIENVIALCAHHHRQAHYGRDTAALEVAFLDKLRLFRQR